jgi:hypothetical protein
MNFSFVEVSWQQCPCGFDGMLIYLFDLYHEICLLSAAKEADVGSAMRCQHHSD